LIRSANVTPSISAPFAAWLACKFDLDPSVLSVEFDTPEARRVGDDVEESAGSPELFSLLSRRVDSICKGAVDFDFGAICGMARLQV
jgi:hypothetical protein